MKKAMLFLLCTMLLLTLALPVLADVDFSFDDGGASDFGFGGSDFDFDFGSGTYGSYGSDDGNFLYGGIAVVIVIIIIIAVSNKKGRHSVYPHTGAPATVSMAGDGGRSEQEVIALIRADDPAFSAEELKAYAKDCFVRLQEAWELRDAGQVLGFATDSYAKMNARNMQQLIAAGHINHMDNQCVLSCELCDRRVDGKLEVAVLRLHATLIDYTTDEKTGNIVSGDPGIRCDRWYRLEFVRTVGVKTNNEAGLTAHQCPSCGAAIEVNATGHCAYCGNAITSGEYGWVLNGYTRWSR